MALMGSVSANSSEPTETYLVANAMPKPDSGKKMAKRISILNAIAAVIPIGRAIPFSALKAQVKGVIVPQNRPDRAIYPCQVAPKNRTTDDKSNHGFHNIPDEYQRALPFSSTRGAFLVQRVAAAMLTQIHLQYSTDHIGCFDTGDAIADT
ncbi:MAG: hypothetical protein V8Q32_01555 [Anaerotignum faecicola]